jgi:1,4-dihydroxy-2-naphthoate polyprenyltransferase
LHLKVWIQAARLRTLPLAIAGTLAGNVLAYMEKDTLNIPVFVLSVLTAICLQVLANFANDYGDFKNGADTKERTDRVMASGLITEQKMRWAIAVLIGICFLFGISLLVISINSFNKVFWLFLGLGIASMLAAYFYTAGKKPYGYIGLGDIFVFVFFGWVSVAGTYFLQTNTFDLPVALLASAIGMLSVGVLNINNIRDIGTDKEKNKITIPVRLGHKHALVYQMCLISLAFICLITYTYGNLFGSIGMLIFLALMSKHYTSLRKAEKREQYNGQLKFLSLLTLLLPIMLFCSELASRFFY